MENKDSTSDTTSNPISLSPIFTILSELSVGNLGEIDQTTGLPARWPQQEDWSKSNDVTVNSSGPDANDEKIKEQLSQLEERFNGFLSASSKGAKSKVTTFDLLNGAARLQGLICKPGWDHHDQTYSYFIRWLTLHLGILKACEVRGDALAGARLIILVEDARRYLQDVADSASTWRRDQIQVRRTRIGIDYVEDAYLGNALTKGFDAVNESRELQATLDALRAELGARHVEDLRIGSRVALVDRIHPLPAPLGEPPAEEPPVEAEQSTGTKLPAPPGEPPAEEPPVEAEKPTGTESAESGADTNELDVARLSEFGAALFARPTLVIKLRGASAESMPRQAAQVQQMQTQGPDVWSMLSTLNDFAQIPLSSIPVVGPTISAAFNLITRLSSPDEEARWRMFRDELKSYTDLKIEQATENHILAELSANKGLYNGFMRDFTPILQQRPSARPEGGLRERANDVISLTKRLRGYCLALEPQYVLARYFAEFMEQQISALGLMAKVDSNYNIAAEVTELYELVTDWFMRACGHAENNRRGHLQDHQRGGFWNYQKQMMCTYCGGWLTNDLYGSWAQERELDNMWDYIRTYARDKAALSAITHRLVLPGVYRTILELERKWKNQCGFQFRPMQGYYPGVQAFFERFFQARIPPITTNIARIRWLDPWFFNADCDYRYRWAAGNETLYSYTDQGYVISQLKDRKNWWIPVTHRDPERGIPSYQLK